MTKTEWAAVLAGLPKGKELKEALMALSDEDWVSEKGRDFLRDRAGSLRPIVQGGAAWWFNHPFMPMCGHNWVPGWLGQRMGINYPAELLRYHRDAGDCWLSLLKGISDYE